MRKAAPTVQPHQSFRLLKHVRTEPGIPLFKPRSAPVGFVTTESVLHITVEFSKYRSGGGSTIPRCRRFIERGRSPNAARRVNPVILLGLIIVAVLSFGPLLCLAEDGLLPRAFAKRASRPTITALREPSVRWPPLEGPAREHYRSVEGKVPEVNAPVGDAVPRKSLRRRGRASSDTEDALKEVTTPEESPRQGCGERRCRGCFDAEAEIGRSPRGWQLVQGCNGAGRRWGGSTTRSRRERAGHRISETGRSRDA